MNTEIYIAPSRRKSSEALAAEQMMYRVYVVLNVKIAIISR